MIAVVKAVASFVMSLLICLLLNYIFWFSMRARDQDPTVGGAYLAMFMLTSVYVVPGWAFGLAFILHKGLFTK